MGTADRQVFCSNISPYRFCAFAMRELRLSSHSSISSREPSASSAAMAYAIWSAITFHGSIARDACAYACASSVFKFTMT